MKKASFAHTVGMEKNRVNVKDTEVFRKNSKYLLLFIVRNVTFYLEEFLNTNKHENRKVRLWDSQKHLKRYQTRFVVKY